MAKVAKWEMNDNQKAFVELVKGYENGVTLFELKLAGYDFKTGTVNPLLTKEILVNAGEREFKCDVLFEGVKVGTVTKKGVIYKVNA